MFLDAIARAYDAYQDKPRINLKDVYGKQGGYNYEPIFWELVLSYQLLDNKVKIKDLDYDRRTDGLYNDNAQPFADFEIIDKELKQVIQTISDNQKTTPAIAADSTTRVTIQRCITQRSYDAPTGTLFLVVLKLRLSRKGKDKAMLSVKPYKAAQ